MTRMSGSVQLTYLSRRTTGPRAINGKVCWTAHFVPGSFSFGHNPPDFSSLLGVPIHVGRPEA